MKKHLQCWLQYYTQATGRPFELLLRLTSLITDGSHNGQEPHRQDQANSMKLDTKISAQHQHIAATTFKGVLTIFEAHLKDILWWCSLTTWRQSQKIDMQYVPWPAIGRSWPLSEVDTKAISVNIVSSNSGGV